MVSYSPRQRLHQGWQGEQSVYWDERPMPFTASPREIASADWQTLYQCRECGTCRQALQQAGLASALTVHLPGR
jgi:hypothetical protein